MTGLNEVIKAKLLTSNQVYLGYSLDELLLLRKYKGSIPPSTKGFLTDYFGIKTRFSYFSTANNNMDDQELVVGLPFPDDRVHAEAIEYLAAAKAVDLARDQFVCVELGAGWGPWLALTGTMARKMGIKNVTLVGVEADRKRLAFMKSHFADNGLPVPDDDGTAFHRWNPSQNYPRRHIRQVRLRMLFGIGRETHRRRRRRLGDRIRRRPVCCSILSY